MEHIAISLPDFWSAVWAFGWLFTIGYLELPFAWKGVLAVILWPYYLGKYFHKPPTVR